MKEPLKVPFILLFILVCTTFVLAVLDMLAGWGLHDSAARDFSLAYAAEHLPRSLSEALIPAVVLSIVLAGFRLARRPFSRFLALLIVLGVSYAVLVNGMLWLRTISSAVRGAPAAAPQYVRPSTFLAVGDTVINVSEVNGASVRGVLVVEPSRSQNRLSVLPAGTLTVRDGVLTLSAPGRTAVARGTSDLTWTDVFSADRFTAAFLRDISVLTADFRELLAGSLGAFFAACFSLVFLAAASLVLLRITRWPLLNIVLLVAAARGIFSLYHLLAVNLAPQVARAVSDPLLVRLFPSAAMAAAAVLLLLVDVLFVPADRWAQEPQP